MELENENIAEQTTEQSEELDLSAFDDGWGDAPSEDDGFELEADDVQEPETEKPAGEGTDTQTEAEPAENTETHDNAEGSQLYTIKHLNKEGKYTIDEVLEYAGKGMDYDFVREERDDLKRERAALNSQTDFLKELARRSGDSSIDQHLDRIRAMWSMQDSKNAGGEMSAEEALVRATQTRLSTPEPEETPEQEAEPAHAEEAEEADNGGDAAERQAMFRDFIAEYPGVKPEDIPKEVWNECARTGNLVSAYRKHENSRLKAELEELKQNKRNKERSTGSWQSAGAPTPKDAFDEGWDSV